MDLFTQIFCVYVFYELCLKKYIAAFIILKKEKYIDKEKINLTLITQIIKIYTLKYKFSITRFDPATI